MLSTILKHDIAVYTDAYQNHIIELSRCYVIHEGYYRQRRVAAESVVRALTHYQQTLTAPLHGKVRQKVDAN